MEKQGKPILSFETQTDLETWLESNHASSDGFWLMMAKKSSGIASVNYLQAVESVLCFGWIDSQAAGYDAVYHLQKLTPRRPKSRWSQINCGRAEALIAAGRMRPAGLREVELARADGRWDAAYPSQRTMTVPDDFQQLLETNPAARAFFDALDGANRYAILLRLHTASTAQTRARRMTKILTMLENGQKIYP